MAQSNGLRGVCAGVLVLVSALGSASVSARSLTDLDAVHQSAAERTLVMRVAKAHLQLAAGVDRDQARQALTTSIAQYEKNLDQLEANSPNSAINQRIVKIKGLWQDYKAMAQSKPSRESVVALLEASDNLLFQSDALVRDWQMRLPQNQGERSDLALQQGMLSERIGLFYAAHNYGINEPWVLEEMNYSMQAYEKGMSQLRSAAWNDGETRALTQLDTQWHAARGGLQQVTSGRSAPALVAVAMESLYQQSNELGALYREDDRMEMLGRGITMGLASNVPME
ncbi:MAG: type IV pili methyl-accepting chemotaxis transducer N-terminal domain-containing protein [Pseudomonadota bacterium]